eukprot:COSAG01_NODE_55601_length_324_cov_0.560000_1_plen_62_part_01
MIAQAQGSTHQAPEARHKGIQRAVSVTALVDGQQRTQASVKLAHHDVLLELNAFQGRDRLRV